MGTLDQKVVKDPLETRVKEELMAEMVTVARRERKDRRV